MHETAAEITPRRARRWFHYSNLKVEAAIFMLIALTFAAVLGQDAVTSQSLDLVRKAGLYYPFSYGDKDEGGKSTVDFDATSPLKWSCTLRAGAAYAYCGYGLQLDVEGDGTGIDLSKYQTLDLAMTYTGAGTHQRLLIQTAVPDTLRDRTKPGETMPMVAEFQVSEGENRVSLNLDELTVESWWLSSHDIATDEVKPSLENVVSIAFSSGSVAPLGRFDVEVRSVTFKGYSLSTAHWYLLILGAWLVLTGAFLVYRFLSLRRGYEVRQRRQAEKSRELAAARAAAEAASSAKSQFLANMSHELRTPLNAILGYAQLLEAGEMTRQQAAAVKIIHASGEHLLTVITDILDIAKVEAGKMDLLPAPFDIHACVFSVAQMVRMRAEEKGLRFVVTVADDVPQAVIADQKRLRQVLINLLGNAVKFTVAGEVRLEVCAIAADLSRVRLRFDVCDTGVGIAPDQIDSIFRPFEQAGNAIARSGGTGLGLSITHRIVEMMGGVIQVESRTGQGSRFRVEADFSRDGSDAAGACGVALIEPVSSVPAETVAETTAETSIVPVMTAPPGEVMARLIALARAGNLRAIRQEIPAIVSLGAQYREFAERLDDLAAAYQSPAVLRLVEQYAQERSAA